ncbi:MAG: HAD-IIB family hydrolase [Desulfobacterales bacterium]|jgi:HAD superfamily hydrolase (TIGR01484 family)
MKPFYQFPKSARKKIRFILSDIDDTLTLKGRLPAVAFSAMERLQTTGIAVVPITGRPAGWCDHIARMWPVDAVVGENGAFYFRYDEQQRKMQRRYWRSEAQRKKDRGKLEKIKSAILEKVPGSGVAADQAYREADLAIDYCEDVPPLEMEQVAKIVHCFKQAGAQAKISSIHVNGWFGDYDKRAMAKRLFEEVFETDMERDKKQILFIGDSPNDIPMFKYFPHSVAVANILRFENIIDTKPAWVTEKEGGYGFAEMVEILLSK